MFVRHPNVYVCQVGNWIYTSEAQRIHLSWRKQGRRSNGVAIEIVGDLGASGILQVVLQEFHV